MPTAIANTPVWGYNVGAEGLDVARPTAVYNWGTGLYQMPLGDERLALWAPATTPGGARTYLGTVTGPFNTPEQFKAALGQTPVMAGEGDAQYFTGEYTPLDVAGLAARAGAPPLPPEQIQFSENPAERRVTLQPGTVRALLGTPHTQVGASVPAYISQQGPQAAAKYVGGTQPQTWQFHQPGPLESIIAKAGPIASILGTILSFTPLAPVGVALNVLGGISNIATGIDKGDWLRTAGGFLSLGLPVARGIASGLGGGASLPAVQPPGDVTGGLSQGLVGAEEAFPGASTLGVANPGLLGAEEAFPGASALGTGAPGPTIPAPVGAATGSAVDQALRLVRPAVGAGSSLLKALLPSGEGSPAATAPPATAPAAPAPPAPPAPGAPAAASIDWNALPALRALLAPRPSLPATAPPVSLALPGMDFGLLSLANAIRPRAAPIAGLA